IERIEVVRGPVSTLYGSDAMGGVVNVITRKVSDRWRGSVTLDTTLQENDEFGNIYAGNFYLSGPLLADKLGLSINGRRQEREQSHLTYADKNGNRIPVAGFGPSPTKHEIWSLGARLNFTPSANHDLWLDVDTSKQWYDNSKSQMGTNTPAGGYEDFLEFNRNQYLLAHNWRLSFGELQTTLSRVETETLGRLIPTGFPNPELTGQPRQLESVSDTFDIKLYSNLNNHNFTIGAQYWDAEMIEGLWPQPFEHQQWAVFAEDEWRFTNTLALTLGARHDDHSTFGSHFSPRAYLVWNATPNWTVKGGVSQGFKTPSLDSLAPGINGLGRQGALPLLGTPTLQPETSTTTEMSVFYDNRRDFRVSLTVFNNKFEDKISTGVPVKNCAFGVSTTEYNAGNYSKTDCVDVGHWPNDEFFGQRVNIDEAVTRGVETNFRYLIGEGWSLTGNYTYTDSEQKSGEQKGRPLTNTPAHMINGSVRYQATDNLNLWLRGEYRSSRYRDEDTGSLNAKALYGDYRAYGLFNIGGSYSFNERVRLNAAIYNLFDKDFVIYKPHTASNGREAYTKIYTNNQEPRRLWLSLTTEF
ncbi:MAG: TonB-dependent receptor, partial [Asticcacaulis sp.]